MACRMAIFRLVANVGAGCRVECAVVAAHQGHICGLKVPIDPPSSPTNMDVFVGHLSEPES